MCLEKLKKKMCFDALVLFVFLSNMLFSIIWVLLFNDIRATPVVSQNREQKPFLDAKGKKRCSSSGVIAGAKIWLLNSDKQNLAKYS